MHINKVLKCISKLIGCFLLNYYRIYKISFNYKIHINEYTHIIFIK